jgi:hypothetical protein
MKVTRKQGTYLRTALSAFSCLIDCNKKGADILKLSYNDSNVDYVAHGLMFILPHWLRVHWFEWAV